MQVFGTSSMSAYFFHEALLFFPVFGFSFAKLWGHQTGWGLYAVLTFALIAATFALCDVLERVQRQSQRLVMPRTSSSD
jgi:hypothetical protein